MHGEVEQYLEASGLAWTHLRPSQFMQVYFREVPTIVADGTLRLPMADVPLTPVDVEDIAKAAVALLTTDGHEGRRYDMTGPEALTMAQVAERIGAAIGRPVRYIDIDPEAKRQTLLDAGIPEYFADAMDELFAERRRGVESQVDLSTHTSLGIHPTPFAEFAHRSADILRGADAPTHLWASGWEPVN
jgi:uncharacterized protein YbjT (DUF2867 family)